MARKPDAKAFVGDVIWWSFFAWLLFLLVSGFALQAYERGLRTSGFMPFVESVGVGIGKVTAQYWYWTVAAALLSGYLLASSRSPHK